MSEPGIESGDVEVFTLTPALMCSWLNTAVRGTLIVLIGYYTLCTLLLVSYRWVDPPTTGVQIQRAVSAWWTGDAFERSYRPVSLADIDDDLELAVVSAEDTRFFQHTGIDWKAIGEAIEDNRERGRLYRGGSTITQQLAKNLFQTTHSSLIRKGLEVPLTFLTELVLSKERILELYLNVIEWGPGVFGAEAAAQHHYGRAAASMTRWHAAALAACIPNPHVRTPSRMTHYTRTILGRMRQVERFEAYF
ncbi:monofunctional biosynthetic peptidoglycan transglycosylase [Longibacter sp.]|uniref:monofunctional biosynthetic peptidoglycan transglycosylase n=1 Tax=Longibacter sp. TaxID=2045415 RepID=UPI003EB893FB